MRETAEAHSAIIGSSRNCVIEISNFSTQYMLYNPKIFMESGCAFSPPQPTIRSNKTEVCSFTSKSKATGAVGVLTYELLNMHSRQATSLLAVMFSVPSDYNIYKNWLSLGFFDQSQPTDEKLYELMYEGDPGDKFMRHESDGSGVTFTRESLTLRGTMSDEGRAMVKLELYDKMT
ncbi:uncharacterized protein V6R79_012659 [Siganus canaliculatus]